MKNRCLGLLALVTATLAIGCGGGGGGGTSHSVSPSVSVAWPQRSRDLQAPSSALSVHIVLHRTDKTGTDAVIDADRNATLTAHTETYSSTTPLVTKGTYALTATFYANPGEAGAVVATAAADVKVSDSGTLTNVQGNPLGNVAFSGKVSSASVVSGQFVRVGDQLSLTASAMDAEDNIIAVTPGSFIYSVASGGSNLTITPDGTVTGVQTGNATVVASIDGVASAPETVSVIPASAQVTKINLEANDLIYDAGRDTIYATTSNSAPTFPHSVVPIDPATGALGTPIPLDNQPTWMALSGDGNHLYVGGNTGSIKQLAMPAGTVENTILLPVGKVPSYMLTVPNTTNTWVVALQNGPGNTASDQAIVFDGIAARPGTAPMGNYVTVNDAGTRLYGFQRFQSSNSHYYTADISAAGLTNATSTVTAIQGFGNRIHWVNGKILADDGTIANPDTVQVTGHLNFSTIDHLTGAVPVPNSDRVYFASWDPKQVQTYDLPGPAPINSVALGAVSGGLETITWAGPKRVVLRSFSGSPNTVIIVSGLP